MVPAKGADTEWVSKQLVRDLEQLGDRGRLVTRSDQEPTLVSLLEEVEKLRGDSTTVLEHSLVGDSLSVVQVPEQGGRDDFATRQ